MMFFFICFINIIVLHSVQQGISTTKKVRDTDMFRYYKGRDDVQHDGKNCRHPCSWPFCRIWILSASLYLPHTVRKEQESWRKGEYSGILQLDLYINNLSRRTIGWYSVLAECPQCSSQSAREQYTRTKSYFGQPFIFNMIHTFGGQLAMFGRAHNINTRQITATYKHCIQIRNIECASHTEMEFLNSIFSRGFGE